VRVVDCMDMNANENSYPLTVAEAVELLHANMCLNEEFMLAYMDEVDLTDLHLSLGHDIRDEFGLWTGNEALMESCRVIAGDENLHVDDASMVIVRALWEKVKKSNILEDNG
jgi:hypothetical protein